MYGLPRNLQLHKACSRTVDRLDLGPEIWQTANRVRQAYTWIGGQIPPLSEEEPDFTSAKAYQINAAACKQLRRSTYTPIGRKIGFTNRKVWSKDLPEPIWGYLWQHRTYERVRHIHLPASVFTLQPRIEPEIVFGLKSQPNSSMSDEELLSCIEWMTCGLEVVISLYKDWKFTLADAIAVNALHERLYIGRRTSIDHLDPSALLSELENFVLTLYEGTSKDARRYTGQGKNVLGSPIKALSHLCRMLESQSLHPQLCAGEIISTGTITEAVPVEDKEMWVTEFEGISVPGLSKKIVRVEPSAKIGARGTFKQLVLDSSNRTSRSTISNPGGAKD